MEEGEQQFQLHLGLKIRKAVLNVTQHLGVELRADRTAGPTVVRRAKLVMKPQRRVAVPYVRHVGRGLHVRRRARNKSPALEIEHRQPVTASGRFAGMSGSLSLSLSASRCAPSSGTRDCDTLSSSALPGRVSGGVR
jgi:hypothetical protein